MMLIGNKMKIKNLGSTKVRHKIGKESVKVLGILQISGSFCLIMSCQSTNKAAFLCARLK